MKLTVSKFGLRRYGQKEGMGSAGIESVLYERRHTTVLLSDELTAITRLTR